MRRHPWLTLAAATVLLALGAGLFLFGQREADAAADELVVAQAAHEEAEEARHAVEVDDGVIDRSLTEAEATATALVGDLEDAQAASVLRVTALRRLADLYQQALDAMRANDGSGYNAGIDEENAQLDVVLDSQAPMEAALAPLLDLVGQLRGDLDDAAAVPEG